MTQEDHSTLLEALLLVSDKPLAPKELAEFLADIDPDQAESAFQQLAELYDTREGGLRIEKVAGGYRMATRPEHGEAIREFFRFKKRQKLSRAALETLAVVAYRQPATHPEVQEIRRISSEGVLKTLLERRLIRVTGRKNTVGKPLLYGTTREFLEHFGLASLDDLPPIEKLEELMAEVEGVASGQPVDGAGTAMDEPGSAEAPTGDSPILNGIHPAPAGPAVLGKPEPV